MIQMGTAKEEPGKEKSLNKHEFLLRKLIMGGFEPIYVADMVQVSGDCRYSKNPHKGKAGRVTGLKVCMEAKLNIDYLTYQIRTGEGESFETPYYTLDRTRQAEGNQILEQVLRDTNSEFEAKHRY